MPVKTNWDLPLLHWQCIGDVHNHEFMTCLNQMNRDPLYDKIKFEIFDCSQCDNLYMTKDQVLFYAGHDIGRVVNGEKIKIALVADKAKIIDTVSIYKDYMDTYNSPSWEVQIFQSLAEAFAWINTTLDQ